MSTDGNNPVVLRSVENDVEAAAIVTALDAGGIQANVTGSYTAGFRAEAPGQVHVMVRSRDIDAARRILAELDNDESTVDWSQIDVGHSEDDSVDHGS